MRRLLSTIHHNQSTIMSKKYLNFDKIGNPPQLMQVIDYINLHSRDLIGNPNSSHGLGSEANLRYNAAKQDILNLFPGFDNVEVLAGGGSVANMRAIEGVLSFFPSNKLKRDIVMVSQIEHKSINTFAIRHLTQRGYTIMKVVVVHILMLVYLELFKICMT